MANADSVNYPGRSNKNTSDRRNITTQKSIDVGSTKVKPAGLKTPKPSGYGY